MARKSIITLVAPIVQQIVEVVTFQGAAEVATSLDTKASKLVVPIQLKQVRTKTTPNTHREQSEKERAQIVQDMAKE